MSTDHDPADDRLRQAFAELRGADAAGAPSFAAVTTSARKVRGAPSMAPLLGRALAAAALAAAVAVGLSVRRPPGPPAIASIEPWTAPTDFLLRTPGSDVLDSVPHIVPRRPLLDVTAGQPSNRRSPSP
jgi:hypothetical protein